MSDLACPLRPRGTFYSPPLGCFWNSVLRPSEPFGRGLRSGVLTATISGHTPPPHCHHGALGSRPLKRLVLGARGGRQGRPVHALVLEQVLLLAEAAAAGGAQVGPLARVVAPVPRQVGLLAEAAAALGARVGPLARVDAPVDGERRPPREALAALAADELALLARPRGGGGGGGRVPSYQVTAGFASSSLARPQPIRAQRRCSRAGGPETRASSGGTGAARR